MSARPPLPALAGRRGRAPADPLPAAPPGPRRPCSFPRDPLSIAGPALLPPFQTGRCRSAPTGSAATCWPALLHGARTSLAVGLAAAAAAIAVGALVGTLAGFAGGLVDEALMRITDAFQTVPGFLLALAFVSVVGPSLAPS